MNTTRNCVICGLATRSLFEILIFDKKRLLNECQNPDCGQAQFQDVDWLERAYSSAIVALDTGAVQRSLGIRKVIASIATLALRKKDHMGLRVLDYGGGTGLLCRLLRDVGFDCYSQDKYCENVYSRPFQASAMHYDVVTMVEVLEHLENPILEIKEVIDAYSPEMVIATTVLKPDNITRDWWYLTPSTGQHINFYTANSLRKVAQAMGYGVYIHGSVIVFVKGGFGIMQNFLLSLSTNKFVKNIIFFVRVFVYRASYRRDFDRLRNK